MSSFVWIGIIEDFDLERPSHKATNEAINRCAAYLGMDLEMQWLPTESFLPQKSRINILRKEII